MAALDKTALALVIIGAINWGLVGLFQFDAVAWIGGGASGLLARIIYTIVGIAGLWCISILFRPSENHSAGVSRMYDTNM